MWSLSIKIPNVSQSLEDKLEALILGGAFWPDQPLASERRLAEEFDVSRTTLRNALSDLCDKGLLTLVNKRYRVTNVMADLLSPGFRKIAREEPRFLLDYWVLLFDEAVRLASKKGQSSDQVEVQRSVRELKQYIVGEDSNAAIAAFEKLNRAVFDSCYNFFLSQTHHALRTATQSYFERAIASLCRAPDDFADALSIINSIGAFDPRTEAFAALLTPAFAELDHTGAVGEDAPGTANPHQLIDVTLRHNVAFESVYELRLITEKHAAKQAAKNATADQLKALKTHLDAMTVVADVSPADYSKLDTELHHILAQCTQNPVFPVIDAALAPVFSRTTNQWLKRHMEMRNDQSLIHLQHTEIVEAIMAHDPAAALAAMNEHLAYVLHNLRHLRAQDHFHEIATARRLLS